MRRYDVFIITSMKDFRKQTQLAAGLNDHNSVRMDEGGFMIFNLGECLD